MNIGFFELGLFLAVALIVLGPEKLPHAARTLGRYYVKLKRTQSLLKARLENELNLSHIQEVMQAELHQLQQSKLALEQKLNALEQHLHAHTTRPMHAHFFLLSDFDKARLLPPAPFLPSHQALSLLNDTPDSSKSALKSSPQNRPHD